MKNPTNFKTSLSKKKKLFIEKVKNSREICQKFYLVQVRISKEEIIKNSSYEQVLVCADNEKEAEDFAIYNYASYLINPVACYPWNRTTTWRI